MIYPLDNLNTIKKLKNNIILFNKYSFFSKIIYSIFYMLILFAIFEFSISYIKFNKIIKLLIISVEIIICILAVINICTKNRKIIIKMGNSIIFLDNNLFNSTEISENYNNIEKIVICYKYLGMDDGGENYEYQLLFRNKEKDGFLIMKSSSYDNIFDLANKISKITKISIEDNSDITDYKSYKKILY